MTALATAWRIKADWDGRSLGVIHSLAIFPTGANGAGQDLCQGGPEGTTCDAKRP
jgi:hypothetical protein